MNDKNNALMYVAIGVLIPFALALMIPIADSAIPPTPAFFSIGSNDTDASTNPALVQSDSYQSKLMIVTDGSILVEAINYNGGDK